MYRIRFFITLAKCFLSPTKNLLDDFKVSFIAIPLIDTDVSRLFTHSYTLFMGICRWHFVFNSQFRNVALKQGWVPVTTAETITYRRSIKAFDRIVVKTNLLHWNSKRFYLEHTFLVRGEIRAHCYVEGLIRGPGGILEPPEVFQQLGLTQESPVAPPSLEKWISLSSPRF